MKNYDEIKDIIVNKLGLKGMEDYKAWVAPFHEKDPAKRRIITQEDIDLLSPDVVDNNAFWKVVEDIFGPDCIGSTNYGQLQNVIDNANTRNFSLARQTGMLNIVDDCKHSGVTLTEIGAGYGFFKQYCLANTNYRYAGFDVVPRAPGIHACNTDGTLPQAYMDQLKEQVTVIYSSNVFQHLSNRQRNKYYEDIHTLMNKDGVFVFNMLVSADNPENIGPEGKFAEDGKMYLKHYGQFTEIPYYEKAIAELRKYFNILYEMRRNRDLFYTFTCLKKDLTPPQAPASVVV